ncbi:hypothetical protein BX661DRAFT_195384 [Kickxella alabastrina]|uniref:uncharacterized protein n=1 Tax=Kickxella alabastrina TaxID=61397 RepID=UPI0022210822|nr:uncharacterized protein BX661DRAFT_195384 [Kickxella alabastrina]KAI7834785.1 hypothetical protein BX661DRAFT_195384 [Kickxella alabastrina]
MEDCLKTFGADETKIKDGGKVPSGRQKWNRNMAAMLSFRIIISALLTGNCPPHFSRKNALSESARPESTVTPDTLLKPKPRPKPKRMRKNPSAPVSSLQKKQRTD